MKVVTTVAELRREISRRWNAGERVGLVPTMGFFHEGHLELMRIMRRQCDFLVVSLFVNPTQFGPHEDLEAYPRDAERDHRLAAETGVDLVFQPSVEEIYPPGFATYVEFTHGHDILCGASRPGHFRGVGTVVLKLFSLVQPHAAIFGRKDAQQLFLIRQMVRDFNLPLEIVAGPLVREADGLALSSRNSYLQPDERKEALALHDALAAVARLYEAGETQAEILKAAGEQVFARYPGFQPEYLEFRDWRTLETVQRVSGPVLAAVAGRVGRTRLIDNIILEGEGPGSVEW